MVGCTADSDLEEELARCSEYMKKNNPDEGAAANKEDGEVRTGIRLPGTCLVLVLIHYSAFSAAKAM